MTTFMVTMETTASRVIPVEAPDFETAMAQAERIVKAQRNTVRWGIDIDRAEATALEAVERDYEGERRRRRPLRLMMRGVA